ncbi:MAG: DUF192 domain-containing protein [Vampirovibrionales bacterium]|nr:DUF192 domain-containing protein [Vampirovibrionales bacterium]
MSTTKESMPGSSSHKPLKAKGGMAVSNAVRGTQLVIALEVASNPWTRFKGLMGRPALEKGAGLWIEPCSDIHSCFMRFPFDAVFLDKANIVVHLMESMPAWRVSKWVRNARVVLELPAGTIEKTNTQLGDQLEFS